MKFSEFLEGKINESEPIIFKGLRGDPYQYKIEGEKVYYSKKSEGTLEATSDKWIEQTTEGGIYAIKNRYSEISSLAKDLTIDEETKEKIIKLQEILNKAKPAIPKLWTLPLTVDGKPGWRTVWSWYMIMMEYPLMDRIDSIEPYSKQAFDQFKIANSSEGIESALDYFQKNLIDSRMTKEGKIDFDVILDDTKKAVDFMIGELAPGSSVYYLNCNSSTKSIPESIIAEVVKVSPDCPLKTLPSSTECKTLIVRSDNASNQFKIPPLKTNDISIYGPVTISPELKQIDYLTIQDYQNVGYEEYPANKIPIPETLKQIGFLYVDSKSVTNLPDDLKIGEILKNYTEDPIKLDPILNNIPIIGDQEEKEEEKKIKKPWLKRIFRKEINKYYYESEDYSIYEGFSGAPGDLDIQDCINIKTLPKGLVVLGNFLIEGSFIETFEDEEIRALCDIKGKIIRSPEEEDILDQ